MQRYGYRPEYGTIQPMADGPYVFYSDAQAALEAKDREIAELKEFIDNAYIKGTEDVKAYCRKKNAELRECLEMPFAIEDEMLAEARDLAWFFAQFAAWKDKARKVLERGKE